MATNEETVEEKVERAISSGKILATQQIRAWIERRRVVTTNPKVQEELEDIVLLLGNGEWAEDV